MVGTVKRQTVTTFDPGVSGDKPCPTCGLRAWAFANTVENLQQTVASLTQEHERDLRELRHAYGLAQDALKHMRATMPDAGPGERPGEERVKAMMQLIGPILAKSGDDINYYRDAGVRRA